MRQKPENIDAYLASLDPDRRAALEKLRKTIVSVLPNAAECISYSMPAFRYAGHVVAGFLATSTGCSYFPFSGKTLAALAGDVESYDQTKSALHFDPKHPLPAALVRKLLKARIAETDGKGAAKGARPALPTRSAADRVSKRSSGTKSKAAGRQAKPVKLLSGGNPQIAKGDGDAPVQAYIAGMPGWKRDVGRQLDALIVRALPNVRKAVKWNSPFYGIEGRGWLLGIHTFTHYVKVAFFRGTSLRPVPPGASKSTETRHVDIREGEKLDGAQMTAWVKQAAALPGWVP